MNNKLILFISFIVLFVSFLNFAGEKKTVAVLPFVARGYIENADNLINMVDDLFTSSLTIYDIFNVVERRFLHKVLEELKFQKNDLFDEKTTTKIGNLTGADIVIMGNVTGFEDKYYFSFRGIDLNSGVALFAQKIAFPSKDYLVNRKIYDMLLKATKISTNINNNKHRVAIPLFGYKGEDFDPIFTELLTENFIISMIESREYNVVERGEIDRAMTELKLQMEDLFDQNNMAKIGSLKGANVVIVGEIKEFEGNYSISATGIKVENGVRAFSRSNSEVIKDKNSLLYMVDEMGNIELAKKRRNAELKELEKQKKEKNTSGTSAGFNKIINEAEKRRWYTDFTGQKHLLFIKNNFNQNFKV